MTYIRLPLADADFRFYPDWLNAAHADRLFHTLRDELPWETHRLHLFGRWVDAPRRSCWIGDPDGIYQYSGAHFTPHPWIAPLAQLRTRLAEEFDIPFNSVLANRYRDGRDSIGWHRDNEPELGRDPVIASLNLGGTRRFSIKHRHDAKRRLSLDLPSGSLLFMGAGSQHDYWHAVPKTARPVAERINLTFRKIAPRRRAA